MPRLCTEYFSFRIRGFLSKTTHCVPYIDETLIAKSENSVWAKSFEGSENPDPKENEEEVSIIENVIYPLTKCISANGHHQVSQRVNNKKLTWLDIITT